MRLIVIDRYITNAVMIVEAVAFEKNGAITGVRPVQSDCYSGIYKTISRSRKLLDFHDYEVRRFVRQSATE